MLITLYLKDDFFVVCKWDSCLKAVEDLNKFRWMFRFSGGRNSFHQFWKSSLFETCGLHKTMYLTYSKGIWAWIMKNAVVVWGCRWFKNSSRACFLLDSTATLTPHNDCSCPASAWDMGQTPDRLVCPSSGAGSSIVCISRHIVTKPFQISRTRV